MIKTVKKITLAATFLCALVGQSFAKEVELDRVAAIVNSGVVLESEVKDLISSVKSNSKKSNQALPSDKVLRIQVMEKLVNDSLVMQIGDRMGIQISDAQLDETLTNMAQENKLSLEEYRQSLVSDGLDYEKYRESVRKELIIGEVKRGSMRRRIYVSPQEITSLIAMMKSQTNSNEEYRVGHILIEFPPEPTQEDMNAAKTRADKVIKLLNDGSDFAKIAITSSGGSNALNGGDLGWKNINELPTLFAELIDGKAKGTVLGPLRTGLGYSIIKIQDIRGREVVEVEEVKARHILITPSIILSEAKAEEMLQGFMEKILAGEADFADLAKEHSEDGTKARGGDLGWSDPGRYDPAFRDTLARLKKGELSKPFRSSFGWHLAQLTDRRTLDATQRVNENKAYQMLYQRKFGMESARWIKELRDEAYIEIMEQSN